MTPWTAARQAPPSIESSRQDYWSGLPFPTPGGLPNPGIESYCPALQADSLLSEPPGKPIKIYKRLLNTYRGTTTMLNVEKVTTARQTQLTLPEFTI